ncbi:MULTISPECIES: tol-pal system-associated acyl-CoA thioesterase [Methylocaldum]|uniref:tol-pal system-associated acyl-CoA thioesterase n=1 Tax=unclassified Methylocaldum TaxID=2622260 RepID=UPI00098A8893|nr:MULTISPECIES: tol-pal system-associated acyl-CoA thioesterase [unclassified Methylocaldum]MBP1148740.1 acyl-CoA thioester hydrolase [Methylocaldum sp. RMAD-M]MVF20792.1 tol-pal system-associated acyl-CoA thioesterase [Methylocaldum sp. BRCS4]
MGDISEQSGFRWPVRVYYEDTDAGGVVYHASYLRFFERARTEFLRSLGFEQDDLRTRHGILFAVRSMQIDYVKAARFNEMLWVSAEVEQLKSASLTFKQLAVRQDNELVCEARVRVVCLVAETFRPTAIPDFLLQRLKNDL